MHNHTLSAVLYSAKCPGVESLAGPAQQPQRLGAGPLATIYPHADHMLFSVCFLEAVKDVRLEGP